MKLLLDEMWSPIIAQELRKRGHDVHAVAERTDLRTKPDEYVFAVAQDEGRAIVTEDAADFTRLAHARIEEGSAHAGLILTHRRSLWRGDRRTVGRLITALDALVRSGVDQKNLEQRLS